MSAVHTVTPPQSPRPIWCGHPPQAFNKRLASHTRPACASPIAIRGLSSSGAENLHRLIWAKWLAVDRLLHGFMLGCRRDLGGFRVA